MFSLHAVDDNTYSNTLLLTDVAHTHSQLHTAISVPVLPSISSRTTCHSNPTTILYMYG